MSNTAEWLHDRIIAFKIHGIIKILTKDLTDTSPKKRCSTSYDMKNRNHTTMSYPHILLAWPTSRALTTQPAGENVKQTVFQMGCTELDVLLPYDPAIALLNIYSKELRNLHPPKNLHPDVCITAFLIAKALSSQVWM